MPDRLSALDVSFFYLEDETTPMHVGEMLIFQAPDAGFDYDRLVTLIRRRIAFVPRYRQRVRWVPGRLANPVWVDDQDFDVAFHVRRSALPSPGTDGQLRELAARIMSRPLDRTRPLWEVYLVEGLQGGRFAILTKTHQAMIDGTAAVDIGQEILDPTPDEKPTPPLHWNPSQEPSAAELLAGALVDGVRRPAGVVESARKGLSDVGQSAADALRGATGLVTALWTAARPAESPLNVPIGAQRRFGTATLDLADFKRIRQYHGGTVNDVVLAVVAGGLRAWLMTRQEHVGTRHTVRAMVPVSVQPDGGRRPGINVAAFLVDLPTGEPDPVVRLNRISFEMAQHSEGGHLVGAQALVGLTGFAPPTLHAMGARLAGDLSRRVANIVVTNVPGPQSPLFIAGAELLAAYPILPLVKNSAVTIGLTSYHGGVFFGLNADRDAMDDIDVLTACLCEAMDELLETTRKARTRAKRARTD
ncbi:MAG TPA: wax ester/triacylglycerol synthase family O-acyltransferase [Actinomycetota bacterium]|nr:wax ester/triacylglycerol synthase family O-acyltransferase [Actinomycetota bacterium]